MKTVLVGLSGGVDSAVAALLLKQQNYNVIGVYMNNWEEKNTCGTCTSFKDFNDVRLIANNIGIKYYSVNFSKQYKQKVFSYFIEGYKKGYTPNPDVLCNREIKFDDFAKLANVFNCDCIATGHYCKIEHKNGVHLLKKAKDETKDQTYFLNQLNQSQLSNVLFPLQDLYKKDVRIIAEKYNLHIAKKKDSTGICFIGERNFKNFLEQYIPQKQGLILDYNGNILGKHNGVWYYTIGQRSNLNIGGIKDNNGAWYVIEKDVQNNILYVEHNNYWKLYGKGLICTNINWIPKQPENNKFVCTAKIRYRQLEQECEVEILQTKTIVMFKNKQRAITIGQFVVFYLQDQCLGGGIIDDIIY